MIRQLIQELKNYFNTIENPTDVEMSFRNQLNSGFFPITSVHRDDLEEKGFDIKKISDNDMVQLAEKMSNDYCTQLFGYSMEIIASDILHFPKTKDTSYPKCNSPHIRFDPSSEQYHCNQCSQTWSDKFYVLVRFPEDTFPFEEKEIGYPSFKSEDNGARYVPEAEYIREFGKSPDTNQYYCLVQWPESQEYMDDSSTDTLNEAIQDEKGLEDFGSSAMWVPLCGIKQ